MSGDDDRCAPMAPLSSPVTEPCDIVSGDAGASGRIGAVVSAFGASIAIRSSSRSGGRTSSLGVLARSLVNAGIAQKEFKAGDR
jgi:hypothetical protein